MAKGTGLDDSGVDFFCTVKFMAVDDRIAILGSGNQGARPESLPPFSLRHLRREGKGLSG